MAARTTGPADDEFDLIHFLWGDLPLLGEHRDAAGAEHETVPPASTYPPTGEDRLVSETAAIQEDGPGWGASTVDQPQPTASADEAADDGDEADAEPGIDLDVLAELAALAEAGYAADDPADDEQEDDPNELILDERPLSYGELTHRLRAKVLPRLRSICGRRGYLTLGNLARAILDLQASNVHLNEIYEFVEQGQIPVLPSRARPGIRHLPLWASRHAQRRFKDLVRDRIDEHVVLQQFGFTGVPLSQCTRAFLVQAWMCHGLSRAEESVLVNTIAEEITRAGENPRNWSRESLLAREALILDNLSMVARVASSYTGRGVELDDLLQFGVLGLMRAVEKYDPGRVDRFVKYASTWVFQSITRHIADHASLIRLPVHVYDRRASITEACARLSQELDREPTMAELAEAGNTAEPIVRAILVTSRPISLDDPRRHAQWALLPDPAGHADQVEENAMADSLRLVLATLSDRERDVVEQRFGLIDGEVRTLEELGQAYGVTRERIRQIESKAMKLLQLPSRINLLCANPPAQSPTPVLGVPASAAKKLLPQFPVGDREIIRRLWGLDRRRQRSAQSTAENLGVSTRYVRDVSFQVAALHRAQNTKPVVRQTATKRHRPANRPQRLIKAPDFHPGWKLGPSDTTSADWAARLFGVSAKHVPVSGLRDAVH